MNCPRCGRELSVSWDHCPTCGLALSATRPPSGQHAAPDEPAPTAFATPGAHDSASTTFAAAGADDDAPTNLASDDAATMLPAASSGHGASSKDTGPLECGEAFGTRYHIIRPLGIGGMGAVYQAWDRELNVAVAIKVIRPEAMADPETANEVERRFKRELLLARQVTHKNVVRIHDIGEIRGIKYITMPYVEGSDLATIVKREGRLAPAKVLKIARPVVSGLVAAHQAGVVHRDLKPANIMIDADDEALIMDFGIARSTGGPMPDKGADGAGGPSGLEGYSAVHAEETVAGTIIGTMHYMAPEQAVGSPVDQRADIYAFGLILYDMLVARHRAEHAESAVAELKSRMEKAPPEARSIVPDVPEAFNQIISRCLEPDASKRYQTSAELAADLDRLDENGELIPTKRVVGLPLVGAGIGLATLLLAGTWYFARGPAVPVQRQPLPVLIAKFDNRTHDPAFDGTLEQALTVGLESASFITAYPRRDAERLVAQIKPGATLDESGALLVADREGLKVVVSGSVDAKNAGYVVSVKAQQSDGKVLSTADATASGRDDALRAVGTLAVKLRRALGDTTPPKAGEGEVFTTTSLEAAHLFYQARELSDAYKNEEAISYYKQVVEKDPKFGRAYAGWANGAFRLGRIDESREQWKKAFTVMDSMTEREKYRTFGLYYATASRNYEKVIENYSTLVKLYPADGAGHNNLALAYLNTSNVPKAVEEGKRVLEIYPNSLLYQGNLTLFSMYASDFEAAAKAAEGMVQQNPTYYPAYMPIAAAALDKMDAAAVSQAYEQMAMSGAAGSSAASLGVADWALYQGRLSDAVAALKAGIAVDEKRQDATGLIAKYTALAEAYEADGKPPLALDAARKAIKLAGSEPSAALPARVLIRLDKTDEAAAVATDLGAQLQPQSRAYAIVLEGEIALRARHTAQAIEAFGAARKLTDLWLARFDSGVAYVQAGQYAEGLADLDECQKRRGEAVAIFFDELPSYHYAAQLPYWLGRAKEELGLKPAALEHYKTFLAGRPGSTKDPLVLDARRRLAS